MIVRSIMYFFVVSLRDVMFNIKDFIKIYLIFKGDYVVLEDL